MKSVRVSLLGAALMLCGASAAHAGPKYIMTAPALRTVGVSQTIFCDIVNLDVVNQDVIIEVMDINGGVVVSLPWTLLPNSGFYQNDSSGNGAWCRFTVNTSTKRFRGIAAYDAGILTGGTGDHYTITIPGY